MEVKTGEIWLEKIPHETKEIKFLYPPFRGTYGEVFDLINKAGFSKPSSGELASLINDAWKNSRGEYEHKILDVLMGGWLWEYTGNLYLPKSNEEVNNGVIMEFNPQIVDGKLSMNKTSLIERLNANDSLVKFIPFGYKIGGMSFRELSINPYILARYGNEGAEKMAIISSKYKGNPFLISFNSVEKEKSSMSGFDNARDNTRLIIGADVWNYYGYGHCYGKK